MNFPSPSVSQVSGEGRPTLRSAPTLRKLQTLLRHMEALKTSLREAHKLVAASARINNIALKTKTSKLFVCFIYLVYFQWVNKVTIVILEQNDKFHPLNVTTQQSSATKGSFALTLYNYYIVASKCFWDIPVSPMLRTTRRGFFTEICPKSI